MNTNRSSHQRCFVIKGVLRNFPKSTAKHLCQSLFIKKETLAHVFSCEFCEISKNTFYKEHLWATASVQNVYYIKINLCSRYVNEMSIKCLKKYLSRNLLQCYLIEEYHSRV